MRQLKNFSSGNKNKQNSNETVNAVMGKYGSMNEEQLIDELIKKVNEQKSNGTYDKKQIENFVKIISPKLNEKQRQKLKRMVDFIDEE